MTSQIMVANGQKAIGPFEDRTSTLHFLSKLGIDSDGIELVEVTTRPPMSDLLVKAMAFLKETRDGTIDTFINTLTDPASMEDAEEALNQARALLDVLSPDRTKLSLVDLALLIHKEQQWRGGGNRITLLKQLREERGLGLAEARDVVQKAGLW